MKVSTARRKQGHWTFLFLILVLSIMIRTQAAFHTRSYHTPASEMLVRGESNRDDQRFTFRNATLTHLPNCFSSDFRLKSTALYAHKADDRKSRTARRAVNVAISESELRQHVSAKYVTGPGGVLRDAVAKATRSCTSEAQAEQLRKLERHPALVLNADYQVNSYLQGRGTT